MVFLLNLGFILEPSFLSRSDLFDFRFRRQVMIDGEKEKAVIQVSSFLTESFLLN